MKRWIALCLMILLLCGALCGCGTTLTENEEDTASPEVQEEPVNSEDGTAKDQEPADTEDGVFTAEEMEITLTEAFKATDYDGFTACFETDEVAIFTLKEPYSLIPDFEDYTLEQYGELLLESNSLNEAQLESKDGLTFFKYEYTDTQTDITYHYTSYIFKNDEAFWLIQFATEQNNYAKYEDAITQWAKSVQFH